MLPVVVATVTVLRKVPLGVPVLLQVWTEWKKDFYLYWLQRGREGVLESTASQAPHLLGEDRPHRDQKVSERKPAERKGRRAETTPTPGRGHAEQKTAAEFTWKNTSSLFLRPF